jgi:prolipoprotein diacylglyceryl transferase
MYPDLSYIIHDIFGTAPDNWLSIFKTFGMLLILTFIVSAYFLRKELIRKEKEGLFKPSMEQIKLGFGAAPMDLVLNGLFGLVLGMKVPYIYQNFAAFKEDPAAILLSGKGNLLLGLVLAAVFAGLKYWEMHRKKLAKPIIKNIQVSPHERIVDITVIAAVSGVIGAKLFAVIESVENFESFLKDPLGQLLSGSGLAIYGGLIVAFIVVYMYVKKKGMKPIHVMDAIAPSLIMGYAVGRIGCQLSGDGDWGIVNNNPQPSWWFLPDNWWAWDYPRNVLEQSFGNKIPDCAFRYCNALIEPVFPTPIYEVIMALIIFAILWALRKKLKPAGALFFLYMIFNGIERFFIEKIRVNPDIEILGIKATQAEYIAVLLVIGGIIGMIWSYRKKTKT